jgi:hypothetical protein
VAYAAGNELEEAINVALKSVNLFNNGVGDKLAGTYSGWFSAPFSVTVALLSPK